MTDIDVQREVARIDSPAIRGDLSELHRSRVLIPPGDWAFIDPFLLLSEDWFREGVFDRHPHRGIETMTYVIEGEIEHYDNHGYKGTIAPGDAQWLTAGRGLIHNENPKNGAMAHTLQLWINLPASDKLVRAHYQNLLAEALPTRYEPGARIKVFSGSSGNAKAPTTNHAPVTMAQIDLTAEATIELDLPARYNGFVLIMEGDAEIGTARTPLKAGQLAWLTAHQAASAVRIRGVATATKALLIAGLPLNEPVAAQGPFVMNTDAQLREGFNEYRIQGDRFGLG